MLWLGILLGLGSAFTQAISYVASRRYIRQHGSSKQLSGASLVLMGVCCAAILLCVRPAHAPTLSQAVRPMALAVIPFFIAMVSLFFALGRVDASRISPLLGLKVFVVALISVAFFGKTLHAVHWISVVLSVAATFLLNQIGGRLPWQAVVGVAATVLGYSISDFGILHTVELFGGNGMMGPMLAACWTYVVLAFFGIALLCIYGWPTRTQWIASIPYSICWLASVFLFFLGLEALNKNVVLAVIIQASRGLQSIALGWLLAHLGHTHLEERLPLNTVFKRAAAALLMMAAIILYVRG